MMKTISKQARNARCTRSAFFGLHDDGLKTVFASRKQCIMTITSMKVNGHANFTGKKARSAAFVRYRRRCRAELASVIIAFVRAASAFAAWHDYSPHARARSAASGAADRRQGNGGR